MRRAKLQHPAEFIKRQTTKQAFVPIHGTDRQMDERIAALLNAALAATIALCVFLVVQYNSVSCGVSFLNLFDQWRPWPTGPALPEGPRALRANRRHWSYFLNLINYNKRIRDYVTRIVMPCYLL